MLLCCGHRLHRIGGVEVPADTVRLVRLQMLASKPQPAGIIPGNLMTGLTIRRYDAFRSCTSFARVKTPERLQPLVDAGIHILAKQSPNSELILVDSHDYYASNQGESLDFHIDEVINNLILNELKRIVDLPALEIRHAWNGYYSQDDRRGIYTRSFGGRVHLVTALAAKAWQRDRS